MVSDAEEFYSEENKNKKIKQNSTAIILQIAPHVHTLHHRLRRAQVQTSACGGLRPHKKKLG